MRVEHYFCDQCKKEVKEYNDLTSVKLETEPYTSYSSKKKVYWNKDICLECCSKLGIKFDEPKTEQQVGEQAKSIESRLFDIVQEMVNNCKE